jgi:hypothetical protein
MNVRFPRLLLLLSAAALMLSSCTILEPGGPSAAVTAVGYSSFPVGTVVERVFVDDGYQPILRSWDGVTFERKASKTDQVLYGDWISGEITQRVKVTITQKGDDKYRVRAIPYVVRDPHDVSFEDQHRRAQLFSFHYSSLLRDVRRQCKELYLTRAPAESN